MIMLGIGSGQITIKETRSKKAKGILFSKERNEGVSLWGGTFDNEKKTIYFAQLGHNWKNTEIYQAYSLKVLSKIFHLTIIHSDPVYWPERVLFIYGYQYAFLTL